MIGGECSGFEKGDKITGKITFPNYLRIVAMQYQIWVGIGGTVDNWTCKLIIIYFNDYINSNLIIYRDY
jgi:hypothetical protein